MKKWIAAALAVLLFAGCLSACGKTDIGGLGNDDRLSASDVQSPSDGDGQPSGSTPSENAPTEPSSESGSQSGGLGLEAYTGVAGCNGGRRREFLLHNGRPAE